MSIPTPPNVPIHVDSSDIDKMYQKLVDADTTVQQMQQHILQMVQSLSGVQFPNFATMQSGLKSGGGQGAIDFLGVSKQLDKAIQDLSEHINNLIKQQSAATQKLNLPNAPPPLPNPQPQNKQQQQQNQQQGSTTQKLNASQLPSAGVNQTQTALNQQQLNQMPMTMRLNQMWLQWLQRQLTPTQNTTINNAPTQPNLTLATTPNANTPMYAGTGNWNQWLGNMAMQAGILNTILPFASNGAQPAQNSASTTNANLQTSGHGGSPSINALGWIGTSIALGTSINQESQVIDTSKSLATKILEPVIAALGTVAPELTGLLGVGAAIGGTYLASQGLEATGLGREQSLLVNVGGLSRQYAHPETQAGLEAGLGKYGSGTLLQQIYQAGADFYSGPSATAQLAAMLAPGMKQQDLVQNLKNTFAFSAVTGETTQTSGQLVRTLSIQGQQSPQQINKIFQELYSSADALGIPMNKLVDSLQTLEESTGGAARSLYDVAGMVAVQKIVGNQFNPGQILSGAMSSQGFGAFGQAALLGMSPAQFLSAQGNQGKMYDAISKRLQQFVGSGKQLANPTASQILMGEGIAQMMGVDLSQYSSENAAQFIRDMLNNAPNQAQILAGKVVQSTPKGGSFVQQGKNVVEATTPEANKILTNAENWLAQNALDIASHFNDVGNAAKSLGDILKTIVDYFFGGSPGSSQSPSKYPNTKTYGNNNLDPSSNSNPTSTDALHAIANIFTGGKAYPNEWPNKLTVNGPQGNWPMSYWMQYASVQQNPPGDADSWPQSMWDSYNQAMTNLGIGNSYPEQIKVNSSHGIDTLGPNLAKMFYAAGGKYGVNPLILMAQAAKESDFRSWVTAPDGGMGIAQFMPGTMSDMESGAGIFGKSLKIGGQTIYNPIYGLKTYLDTSGKTKAGYANPYNPQQEIAMQAYYMAALTQKYGSIDKALQAYNSGSPTGSPGYSSAIEQGVQTITVDINLGGKMQVENLAGALMGTATIPKQKHTIKKKTPSGHRPYLPGNPDNPMMVLDANGQ